MSGGKAKPRKQHFLYVDKGRRYDILRMRPSNCLIRTARIYMGIRRKSGKMTFFLLGRVRRKLRESSRSQKSPEIRKIIHLHQ